MSIKIRPSQQQFAESGNCCALQEGRPATGGQTTRQEDEQPERTIKRAEMTPGEQKVVGRVGIEPTTPGLKVRCSAG